MNYLEMAFNLVGAVIAALSQLKNIHAGDPAQDVTLPHEVEVSYKGGHYIIDGIRVSRRK